MPSEFQKLADALARQFPDDPESPASTPATSRPQAALIPASESANLNESGDFPPAPAESPRPKDLRIPPPAPSLEDRLALARRARRCEHVKPNGLPCGSPALRDGIYCYFHDIWRAESPRRPFRPDPNGFIFKFPLLEDANSIQLALQQVLDSILANKMDLRRAQILLYGLQTAAANVKHTDFDPAWSRLPLSTKLK